MGTEIVLNEIEVSEIIFDTIATTRKHYTVQLIQDRTKEEQAKDDIQKNE
jgi:hypothetical protein